MFSWFAGRQIDVFERQWGYDCGSCVRFLPKQESARFCR